MDTSAGSAKDIKNDIHSFELGTPIAVQDVTGLDKSAIERLHLLADFSITPAGTFNPTADASHDVFTPLTTVRTVGITVSAQILNNECLITDYALNRGEDGSLTWTAPMVLADGAVPTWTT